MRGHRTWYVVWGLAAFTAGLLAGCDRQEPTELSRPESPSSVAARAASPETDSIGSESYDLLLESTVDGTAARPRHFHVSRQRTARGWRTRVGFETVGVGPSATTDGQVATVDIDEDGNQVASDASGHRIHAAAPAEFEALRDKGMTKLPDDVRTRLTTRRPAQASGPKAINPSATLVHRKTETRARLDRMRIAPGMHRVDARGKEHFARVEGTATVDVVADRSAGVVTDVTREEAGRTDQIHYDYIDAGDRTITRRVVMTRARNGKTPPSALSLTYSHVAIDGKEIVP